MGKRLFSPVGIAVEIMMLLLILGVWYGEKTDCSIEQKTAVSANTDRMEIKNERFMYQKEGEPEDKKQDYIKWVEFNVSYEALECAYTYDVETYGEDVHLNWVELLAYLGAKYGGDFTRYKEKDMKDAADKLISGEAAMEALTDFGVKKSFVCITK